MLLAQQVQGAAVGWFLIVIIVIIVLAVIGLGTVIRGRR
jgi:membrane protein required for beta-lactamase induction